MGHKGKNKDKDKEQLQIEDIIERARRNLEIRNREKAERVPVGRRKPPESGRIKINPAVFENPNEPKKKPKKRKKPWITIKQGGLPSLGKRR